jgi:hypothetical protein
LAEPDSAIDALLEVVDAFRQADVTFMIVGGFAVMAHGRPRTTADIDVSVHLGFGERSRLQPIVERLGDGEVEERSDPQWGKRLVTTHPSGLALEVFFTAGHPLYEREFDRRVEITLEGESVPFISPEDLVLRKLVNTKKRAGPDLDDAHAVALTQGEDLDFDYLYEHCAVQRVCGLVDELAEAVETVDAGEG